ncbi:hypothetical protein BBJ28_00023501 [Nothophytophthora sp. Chile5]|nr:hypothetical protein BBJ28_00023501 [Nothophytophthora sp. Chile5]
MSQGRTCHFKLVLLGDTAVGKSCLVVRFVRDEFFEFQEPTIGGMYAFAWVEPCTAFLTQTDSFTGAKSWVKELQRRGDPNVVIALAGNKADLEARRKVEFEEAHQYAEDNDILHMETSAKTAVNVKDLFVAIAKRLPKNPPQPEREAFPITPPQAAKSKSGCC